MIINQKFLKHNLLIEIIFKKYIQYFISKAYIIYKKLKKCYINFVYFDNV